MMNESEGMSMNYSKWLVRSGCTLECANCGHRVPMKMHYIFCPKCGSEINTEEYERELLKRLRADDKQRDNKQRTTYYNEMEETKNDKT